MAIYHLKHASVGRSTHAAGTAGAHVSYITRTGACREVIGSDMPVPAAGERGGEARAWLDEQENADRKNARVIDKVTIALPCELDATQRVELVRAFAAEVTQGRVPWLAAVHDQGKDAENPHAHVVLRDRDLETGKMALRMSQSGSTEMLRGTWERVCNAALERAGVNDRIDRRTLEAQGIDREPTKHIGPQALQIEAREPQGSWKIAALADERAAANERRAPVRDRPAGLFTRAEAFVKGFFGRRDERRTEKAIEERQPAPDHRTPESLRQIRALTERAIDMLDRIRALPDREAPERAVERPEAPSEAQRIIQEAQRAREARVSAREAAEGLSGAMRPEGDPFARYRAQSGDGYLLTNSAEEHQEVIRLLKENTADAQYDRFRRGDLTAIGHITDDPVFSRQLLVQAEMNNRSTGFRMADDLERVMSDNRDFLKGVFETERDRGYDHER
jgi:hypothetical protein